MRAIQRIPTRQVQMFFKNICVVVLWTKVASASEGLKCGKIKSVIPYPGYSYTGSLAPFSLCGALFLVSSFHLPLPSPHYGAEKQDHIVKTRFQKNNPKLPLTQWGQIPK